MVLVVALALALALAPVLVLVRVLVLAQVLVLVPHRQTSIQHRSHEEVVGRFETAGVSGRAWPWGPPMPVAPTAQRRQESQEEEAIGHRSALVVRGGGGWPRGRHGAGILLVAVIRLLRA